MPKNNVHVVPDGPKWAVKIEKSSVPSSTHNHQLNAIKAAKIMAKLTGRELYIHDRHGKIRERNTYGHDPFPPRG